MCSSDLATIGFPEDFDLLGPDADDDHETVAMLFKDPNARYTFSQLLDEADGDADAFNDAFWQAVWSGRIAADGFQALSVASSRRYRLSQPQADSRPAHRSLRRARARARGVALGWPGTWYRVAAPNSAAANIERLEENKERCRVLLDRYGVLSREHANREGGVFRWAAVFPALRMMELSGEIVSGLFFDELSGPQFALPQAIHQLERLQTSGATFWINACDPAAPCGLGLAEPVLPQRRLANHMGWCDGELAIVSESYARRLTVHLAPDDPGLDALLPNLAALARARKRLDTETVNGEPARTSPYLPTLARHLKAVTDHKGVYFEGG